MPDLTGQARRLTSSWRGDALLAAMLVTWGVAYLAAGRPGPDQDWAVLVFVVPYSVAVAARRRWPAAAAGLACALLLAARPLGLAHMLDGALGIPFLWALFFFAYALGTATGFGVGLALAAALAACAIESQGFNPIGLVITLGPWMAGRVVLSHRRMAEQLQARNAELRAGRELFAAESVRYERARIAGNCMTSSRTASA